MEAKRISSKKAFELLEQYNSAIEIYGSTTGKRVNLKACVGACESQLSKSEIANQLINMGMQNEYELTSIGMLGPFRECF